MLYKLGKTSKNLSKLNRIKGIRGKRLVTYCKHISYDAGRFAKCLNPLGIETFSSRQL